MLLDLSSQALSEKADGMSTSPNWLRIRIWYKRAVEDYASARVDEEHDRMVRPSTSSSVL